MCPGPKQATCLHEWNMKRIDRQHRDRERNIFYFEGCTNDGFSGVALVKVSSSSTLSHITAAVEMDPGKVSICSAWSQLWCSCIMQPLLTNCHIHLVSISVYNQTLKSWTLNISSYDP